MYTLQSKVQVILCSDVSHSLFDIFKSLGQDVLVGHIEQGSILGIGLGSLDGIPSVNLPRSLIDDAVDQCDSFLNGDFVSDDDL